MPERQRKPRQDSAKCASVNRPVTFNLKDPFQRELSEYADQVTTNFSAYMKRLIAAEMSRGTYQNSTNERPMPTSLALLERPMDHKRQTAAMEESVLAWDDPESDLF